jgi:NADH-quinone oxidoreductase subunit M
MEFALLQAVFLPLLLAPVAYILGRKMGPTAVTWFTFGLLLYCTFLVISVALGGNYEEHYTWTKLFGEFGFNNLRAKHNSCAVLKTIHDTQVQRVL